MLKNIPFNKYTVFALVWFAVCWFGILKESSGSAPPFPHFDKAAHCGMFFALIWLMARSFLEARRRPPYATLLVFALVFALSSELAQFWFTQTRSAEWADGLADMLGTGLALSLARNVAVIKGVG